MTKLFLPIIGCVLTLSVMGCTTYQGITKIEDGSYAISTHPPGTLFCKSKENGNLTCK